MDSSFLRSRSAVGLIAAALLTSLVLGVAFVAVHRIYDLRGTAAAPVAPLTDEQTRQQVIEPARLFVGAGGLRAANGTYTLMPCAAEDRPPYQGSVYLNFDVPSVTETPAFFRRIAAEMTARGWSEGLPPNHHPGGRTLGKDGVSAIYYRHPDVPGRGVLQIYGECRNLTDHSVDGSGFIDITGQLAG